MGIPVHHQKCRKVNRPFILFVHGITSMCIRKPHNVRSGASSAVYFMYKPRTLKVEPVNKLEKSGK